MRALTLPVRRVAVAAAITFAGTAVLLAVAGTPAYAHHTTVSGVAECDTTSGNWIVAWTVRNSQDNKSAKLIKAEWTPAGSTMSGIFVGAFLPKPRGVLTGTQTVPGTAAQATLTVQGKWESLYPGQPEFVENPPKTGTVVLGGTCQKNRPKPHASAISACDGSVTVTLTNDDDATATAHFHLYGDGGFTANKDVIAGGSQTALVPEANAGSITVKEDADLIASFGWSEPQGCAPVAVSAASTCDTLIVNAENPAGNRTKTFVISNASGQPQEFTLAGGQSQEFRFPGGASSSATVTLKGVLDGTTVTWADPGDCAPPPTTAPPVPTSATPLLAVTGANLTVLIGVAVALILMGAALILSRQSRA